MEMREPVEGVVTVANGFRRCRVFTCILALHLKSTCTPQLAPPLPSHLRGRDPLTGLVCGFADDAPALRCAAAARVSERLIVTPESC